MNDEVAGGEEEEVVGGRRTKKDHLAAWESTQAKVGYGREVCRGRETLVQDHMLSMCSLK